jgi:hypothetical protein
MLPTYGVALSALVFAPNNLAVVATVQQDVVKALAQWEPGIIVNSVSPAAGTDPTTGIAMVNVDFQTGAAAPARLARDREQPRPERRRHRQRRHGQPQWHDDSGRLRRHAGRGRRRLHCRAADCS